MPEKIKCELCGSYYKSLFPAHLKRHGVRLPEYRAMFPGSPYQTVELAKRRSKSAAQINTGRKLSLDSRRKTSRSLIEWFGKAGEKPAYYGWGRRFGNPKKRALERDEYTCQGSDCRGVSTRLVVHHKDADTCNNDLSNLVTLCSSCHARGHGLAPSDETRDKGKVKRIARLRSSVIRCKMSETMKRRWRYRRAAGLPWGKQQGE